MVAGRRIFNFALPFPFTPYLVGISDRSDIHSDGVFSVLASLVYSGHFLYASSVRFEHTLRHVSKSTCLLQFDINGQIIFLHHVFF